MSSRKIIGLNYFLDYCLAVIAFAGLRLRFIKN